MAGDQPEQIDKLVLIDLFKHWDTRVSHQELLFIPLAAAAFPAVAATWDKITPLAVFIVGCASVAVYLYHLFAIRRLAVFQDQIFAKLKRNYTDFGEIVVDAQNRLGMRRLRLLGLPILAILWSTLPLAKLEVPLHRIEFRWWMTVVSQLIVSLSLFAYLWYETTREN